MDLPAGLATRRLTAEDVDAVIAMVNTCEVADSGLPMWERADLLTDIAVPGFDPEQDWVGVVDGDRLVAWGLLTDPRRAWVDVLPDHRGRGIGTWLREWSEQRARAVGSSVVGQTLEDSVADAVGLLRAAGYRSGYSSWVLQREEFEPPVEVALPGSVVIRPARAEEYDTALLVIEQAFSEFTGRTPVALANWRALVVDREGFRPDDLLVAVDDGAIVGAMFLIESDGELWVDKLAVAAGHRGRGLGRALLQRAFRRSWDAGHRRTTLNTDSRTGALTLYERLGMTVTQSYTRWERPL